MGEEGNGGGAGRRGRSGMGVRESKASLWNRTPFHARTVPQSLQLFLRLNSPEHFTSISFTCSLLYGVETRLEKEQILTCTGLTTAITFD